MLKTILCGALVTSVLLPLPLLASADSGHGNEADSASEGGHHEANEGHAGDASSPASLAGAWVALMAARDAIAGAVESGALGDVHEKAEPLPQLVANLLAQSEDLDADKRARVEGAAKQVTRLAGALHVAADGGDAARTRRELTRLNGLLELIRAQYPAGSLNAGTPAHEDHSAEPGTGAHSERATGVVDTTPEATVRVKAFDRLHFEPKRIEVQAGVHTRIELENAGPPTIRSS